jgi:hypothetical protein
MMASWKWVLASALAVSIADASLAAAQPAVPDSVRQIAATAGRPMMLVNVSKAENGALMVEYETPSLSFDILLRRKVWPFVGRVTAGESASPSLSRVGRSIARTIWQAAPSRPEIQTIVLLFRSDDPADNPTRVRLAYPVTELMVEGTGGVPSLPGGTERR